MKLTPEQMCVMFYLPTGKKNAITRTALCAAAGYGDRTVRKIIAELRANGYMIMNDQDGCGYYISDDLNEIERQYKQDTARAMTILKRRKHMRKLLKDAGRAV